MSAGYSSGLGKVWRTRVNRPVPCHWRSVGVIRAYVGHRIRDQGVGGSNPLSPTKLFKKSTRCLRDVEAQETFGYVPLVFMV
jgi:hypothetical protein